MKAQISPEDGGHDRVHGKGTGVQVVDVPDATTDVVAILWVVDGVVDGSRDGQGPADDGEDLVGGDFADGVRLASTKGVD